MNYFYFFFFLFLALLLQLKPLIFYICKKIDKAENLNILGCITFSIGIALTASIVNKRAFTYGFERLRFPNPVFIGDTIHTKVTIKEKKDDPKRPQYGQVNEACEIINQNDKVVCYSEHILLVERKKV